MKCLKFSQIIVLLLLSNVKEKLARTTTYLITPHNEKFLSECESFPDNFVTNAIDISNLSFIYQEDDSLLVNGSITVVEDIPPTAKVTLNIEIFKKQRGEWTNTVFTYRRKDICSTLYRPGEVWYPWTSKIPLDKRACPPPKGIVYTYDDTADAKITLPDRNLDGEYKLQLMVTYGDEPDQFVCTNIIIQVDKV